MSDKDAREEARKRFEAYQLNVHMRLPQDLRRRENGNYWSGEMQQDWELWQAAERAQAPSEQSVEEFWAKWTGPKWMGSSDFQTVGLITVFAFAEAYEKSLAGTQAQAAQPDIQKLIGEFPSPWTESDNRPMAQMIRESLLAVSRPPLDYRVGFNDALKKCVAALEGKPDAQ